MSEFSGHMTMNDGTHVPLSPNEAKNLWESAHKAREEQAARLPDQQSAIDAMHDAYDRLKQLGWRDAKYCPKDGTHFQVIENGSTGIFDCVYAGEWPTGHWMTFDDRDCYPSSTSPAMFKLYPEDEVRQREKMATAARAFCATT